MESKIIIFGPIFMFLWLNIVAHPIYCYFELPIAHMTHPKICLNSKNQWFLGITFSATVNSLDMWYKYHFFNAKQIRHKIYQKFMIQHGGAHGGRYVRADSHQSLIFMAKIFTFNATLVWISSYIAPPHAPHHVESWIFDKFCVLSVWHWKNYTYITYLGC